MTPIKHKHTANLVRLAKKFKSDESGVAAIEFMLTFPILIALLLGCVEYYGHFRAVRKVSNLTASLADIVAQSAETSTVELEALHPLAKSLMQPLDASTIRYRISSIMQGDAADAPTLRWQHVKDSGGDVTFVPVKCNKYTNAHAKVFPANQSSILVEVDYIYNSQFSEFLGGSTTYSDNMIAIPRLSDRVKLTDRNEC